jgi:pimeloyl-ACP methyl ester carboxylesterase
LTGFFHCSGIPNFIQTYRKDPKIHLKLNVNRPIAFLIHGWLDDIQRDWMQAMARDYVRFTRTNVCVINWHPMSVNDYAMAAEKTDEVAKVATKFIKFLTPVGFKYENMTIVGHSMGAHIAGMIGHRTGGKISHIIGLDPAGVQFTKLGRRPTVRLLDRMSARFVQVLHTDKHVIGTTTSLGHQDFWPNNGESPQPGCVVPLLQPDAMSYCK